MEDIKLQFEGFSPPPAVQVYFRQLVEEIREESPTWSTVRATIHRTKDELRGVIRISSHAGAFFATASGRHVAEVGRKLTQRIRRQLGKWKAKRFSHETIRYPKSW